MNKPDLAFIGIGAAKSGTTWLSDCLTEHPEVFIPSQKEICFFYWKAKGSNYNKGFDWYNKFFKNSPENKTLGEFSTHYMYFEESCGLIKSNYPEVKLLCCLRKPEDLAYSLYWWHKANFDTTTVADTFEQALMENPEYIERGLFYKQLKRYYDNFPRENIKIILFENIKNNPEETLREVFTSLNVNPDFKPSILEKKVNKSKKVRSKALAGFVTKILEFMKKVGLERQVRTIISSNRLSDFYTKINKEEFEYPPMKEETRKMLKKEFQKDIEELEKLVGQNLNVLK